MEEKRNKRGQYYEFVVTFVVRFEYIITVF